MPTVPSVKGMRTRVPSSLKTSSVWLPASVGKEMSCSEAINSPVSAFPDVDRAVIPSQEHMAVVGAEPGRRKQIFGFA